MSLEEAERIQDLIVDAMKGAIENKRVVEGKSNTKNASAETDGNEKLRYSIQVLDDGTKYVKLDGIRLTHADGTAYSDREVYNSLIGQDIPTAGESVVRLVKRIGKKDIFNELIRRMPKNSGDIDIKDLKNLRSDLVDNLEDVIRASNLYSANEPDYKNRHLYLGIRGWDQRSVIVADDSHAFNLALSIAIMDDGNHIAYAQKKITENRDIFEKIKEAEGRSEKSLHSIDFSQNISYSNGEFKGITENSEENSSDTRHSLTVDTTGRELSEGQRTYFKDSKVVDENGALKVMYPGTDGEVISRGLSYVTFRSDQVKSVDNLNPTKSDDIRYSITVDGRQVDHLGDVMDMAQHRQFMSQIDTKEASKYQRSADGDSIVPIDNLLVYTDFDKDDPGISKIIRFDTDDYTEISGMTDIILMSENGDITDEQARRIIKEICGETSVSRYDASMFGNAERYDRQAERGKSRSDAYHAEQKQKRRGFSVDAEGNVVNEDIRRQIGIDDIETYDTTTDRVLLQNVAPILEKGA